MNFDNRSTGPLPRIVDADLLFLQYLLIAAACIFLRRSCFNDLQINHLFIVKQLRHKIIQKKGPSGNFLHTIAQFEKYPVQVAILTDE